MCQTCQDHAVVNAILCENYLVTAGHYNSGTPSIFTQVLTAVEDTGVEGSCMATPQRCSDCTEPPSIPFSNQTDCTESSTNSELLQQTHEYHQL